MEIYQRLLRYIDDSRNISAIIKIYRLTDKKRQQQHYIKRLHEVHAASLYYPTSFSRFARSFALHLNTLSSSEYILPDSFVTNGPNDANIKTYKAENGLIAAIKPPAMPIFATIIENSPRDTSVKPIFVEALWDNPALRPAIIPAVKLPIRVMKTAPNANQTAPPSEKGSNA